MAVSKCIEVDTPHLTARSNPRVRRTTEGEGKERQKDKGKEKETSCLCKGDGNRTNLLYFTVLPNRVMMRLHHYLNLHI